MKPKRVGWWVEKFDGFPELREERHPVYEYRGYYIARNYSIANTPSSTYYPIYHRCTFLNDGARVVPNDYCFNIGGEDDAKRLKDACSSIDAYLYEREYYARR